MTDPTIRIPSCRGDDRCPECALRTYRDAYGSGKKVACGCIACPDCALGHAHKLLTEALRQRDEARDLSLRCLDRANHPTKPGAITACCVLDAGHDEPHKFIEMVEEERDAAIEAVEKQRHPCPCGKDTASIKWARCYSCRQAYHAEMERAMAERDAAIKERDSARGTIDDLREALDRQEEEIAGLTKERGAATEDRDEQFAEKERWFGKYQCAAERAERAEALLREIEPVIAREVLSSWIVVRASALLAKIREHLA